ncbi:winged helix DNA-binding protein, partial [Nocardia cyriacigeorgica]|nr:winged helix DNA-binding protein [Nocardia cyriacigeorgica]
RYPPHLLLISMSRDLTSTLFSDFISMSRLSDRRGGRDMVTNRIDRMEAKGLVERVRDPHDRRSVRVRLTAHGVEIVDR